MITPNRLTALRMVIAFTSPLLLIWNRSLAIEIFVMVLFTIACITDWWDGHLARTKSMVTSIGKIADPIADKLLIVGLMSTFSYFELYSFLWVLPILIREVVVTGVRIVRLQHGEVIPAESAGKIKVGFQIVSVYLSLLFLTGLDNGLGDPFLSTLKILHYFGIISVNIVTIISGVIFFNRLGKI